MAGEPQAQPRGVLIATPTADGVVTTGYVESLVAAIGAVASQGRPYRVATLDYFDVGAARNHLAHLALSLPMVSHLLFIDNDMRVERIVFERLLAAQRPMVGAIYTRRRMDIEAYAGARAAGHPPDEARALASPWALRIGRGSLPLAGGLIPVEAIGLGAALIATDLMRRIADAGGVAQVTARSDSGYPPGTPLLDFFGPAPGADGEPLADDFAFCRRALAASPGSVWGYAGPGALHQGQFDYGADFSARLRAIARQSATTRAAGDEAEPGPASTDRTSAQGAGNSDRGTPRG